MSRLNAKLKQLAEDFYGKSLNPDFASDALKLMREEDEFFESIDPAAFRLEFVLSELALTTIYWERLCFEHKIEDEATQKAMLVVIMASFASPKSVDHAKVFSEYFCGDEEVRDLQPLTAIAVKLFKRLNRQPAIKDETQTPQITAGFKRLVEIYEALRSHLNSEFEKVIDSEVTDF